MVQNDLLARLQRIAQASPDAVHFIAERLRENGRHALLDDAPAGGQEELEEVEELLRGDEAPDASFSSLGSVLASGEVVAYLVDMPPDQLEMPANETPVQHAILSLAHSYQSRTEEDDDYIVAPAGGYEEEGGSEGRGYEGAARLPPIPQERSTSSGEDLSYGGSEDATQPLLEAGEKTSAPADVRDASEANLAMPIAESTLVKLTGLYIMVALVAHVCVRIWDIADAESRDGDGWRVFYRTVILLVEVGYGISAIFITVARARRQRVEQLRENGHNAVPFIAKGLLTMLTATDEKKDTIVESVRSHMAAGKPTMLPQRVVILAEAETDAVRGAVSQLQGEFGHVLLFCKEELARQEYVMNATSVSAQALNVVLEENMALGQVLFYAMHRLFLQYGVDISYSAITVMDASSIVDQNHYYPYVIDHLQQPGVAVVSTPTHVRNWSVYGDLVDVTQYERERVYLTGVAADDKLAVNPAAFTARGYSLWRVLRRMELENIDTSNLYWATYTMHIEARQATLGIVTQYAPVTSKLAPTNARTVLCSTLERQVESYDVAMIFERERPFISWELFRPMRAPHIAARAALLMEFTIVTVAIVTAVAHIAPWSTSNAIVGITYLALYVGIMLAHCTSPYGATLRLATSSMRNRILCAPFFWLYFLNLSRFGVDRRGHFKAVGETTTADLVTYKEKQKEELETAAAKAREREVKVREAKRAAEEEAKRKASEERQQKKELLSKRKADAKAQRAEAAAERSAQKEREKKRRAMRGPGAHFRLPEEPVGEGVTGGPEIEIAPEARQRSTTPLMSEAPRVGVSFDLEAASVASGGRGVSSEEAVGEGLFRKAAPPPPDEADDGKSAALTMAATARLKQSHAPVAKAKKRMVRVKANVNFAVPRFKVPPAPANANGRSGRGASHVRMGGIVLLAIPVALILALGALGALYGCFDEVLGPNVPVNYTTGEVLAARSWYISAAALAIFVVLAQLAFSTLLVRLPRACANIVAAPLLAALSFLLVVIVGVLPFVANSTLSERNSVYDLDSLHASHMRFLAASSAGEPYSALWPPFRSASDVAVVHPATGESLSGGWYTGPGLAKFTYPQAMLVTDLAYATLSHFSYLRDMPSGDPSALGLSAADDIRDALVHGSRYLLACHDPATNSVVSHVYTELPANIGGEWAQPEARTGNANVALLDAQNPGTETFAAITAAFALASVALIPYSSSEEALALSNTLRERAEMTYRLMASTHASYEAVYPDAARFWPSDGNTLYDDKLLAAAMMLYATGTNVYKNAVNGYYTFAQQERAARGKLNEFRIDVDDHWWTANSFLANADRINTRYRDNLEPFVNAWMMKGSEGQGISEMDGLTYAQPPRWAAGQGSPFITPGPLGMNLRAMAYVTLWATSQGSESATERGAVCFAKGQLRHIMGLNSDSQSYIVGVAPDGASSPLQPTTRLGGTSSINTPGPNPNVVEGAVVNGPLPSGLYRDERTAAEMNGVGILNNAPLSLLLAGLHSRGLDIEDCIGLDPRKLDEGGTGLAASTQFSTVS